MEELFEEIVVWKRAGDGHAVRYCCFRDLASGRYAVQSADFFLLPIDDARWMQSERQKLELLIESSPGERSGWFDSVEEAIAQHDLAFR